MSEAKRPDYENIAWWTFHGAAGGLLYGAFMASMHGLIGTRTARQMLVNSVIIFSGAGFTYSLARQAVREFRPESRQEESLTDAFMAGCASGVSVGILSGSPLGALGTCLGLGTLSSFAKALEKDPIGGGPMTRKQ